MAEIDVLKAQIVRNDANAPWGFRLQGGADQGQPLRITRITPGSPAARIGLKSGDEVTEIGDSLTQGLTYAAAVDIISHYGQSLILTVERRARGSVPVNPVMNPNQPPPMKAYQTYDMSGGQRNPRYAPQSNVQFHTAESRPFEEPTHHPYVAQPQPQPAPLVPEAQPYTPPQPQYQQHQVGMQAYIPPPPTQHIPEEDLYNAPQSRTFKILQGLMENEEPHAGTAGLPPPRSVSGERWREEQMEKRRPGPHHQAAGPRVKVFMPQQYNSPLGMYSAQNVVETFQNQAEMQMQELESHQDDPVSGARRAVYQDEFQVGGAR